LLKAASDEAGVRISGCVGIGKVGDVPISTGELLQGQRRAGEGVEAPLTLDGAGEDDWLGLGLGCGFLRLFGSEFGVGESFGVTRGKMFGLGELDVVFGGLLENEAALVGVRYEGNVGFGGCAGRCVEVQDHVVGEAGGEDQRGTFDGESDGGFQEAGDVIGVGWAKRRRDGFLD